MVLQQFVLTLAILPSVTTTKFIEFKILRNMINIATLTELNYDCILSIRRSNFAIKIIQLFDVRCVNDLT